MRNTVAKKIRNLVDFKTPPGTPAKTKRKAYQFLKTQQKKHVQTVNQHLSARQQRLRGNKALLPITNQ